MNAHATTESGSLIDEIVREGARRMPAGARFENGSLVERTEEATAA